MSMMSAPASASAAACATAARTEPLCRPPSLKESGVTLRMPITFGGGGGTARARGWRTPVR